MFKGEIKLKQKWFDEFKDKMSTKSLILAGNVEQAVRVSRLCLFKERVLTIEHKLSGFV